MAGPATSLRVISLPAPRAAGAVFRAWDRGEAVAVLDPGAPARKLEATVEAMGAAGVGNGVAALVTTSGTTGEPRAVELTSKGLRASASAVSSALGATSDDRWLACVPLHHVAGLAILSRCRETGASLTVQEGFDVTEVSRAASDCTLVSLVPTMLARLLDANAPLDRFRRVVVGGAPIDGKLLARARGAGATVVTTYGLTETNGGCVHDGRALPGVETSLSGAGEILVRGPVLMRGYHGDEKATLDAFTEDGWLRTGDLGRVQGDGTLVVTDRVKDVIVTGGVNVSPSAVEAVVVRHPAVAEVGVAGVADERFGEQVVAFVIPRERRRLPGEADLRAFCSEWLSPPELPRQVVEVKVLPRTASGKLSRRRLARHVSQ